MGSFSRFLAWSIIVPVSIAFGAVFAVAAPAIHPPSSALAWPLACPGGAVTVESQNFSYKPGQAGVARTLWCQPADNSPRRDVTMRALGILFLLYTALAVLLLRYLVLPWIRRRLAGAISALPETGGHDLPGLVDNIVRQAREAGATVVVTRGGEDETDNPASADAREAGNAAERLAALKAMLDQGLIGAKDYEAKKAEILAQL